MDELTEIEAEITFLTEAEGGRKLPPINLSSGKYRPHLVAGDPTQRQAIIASGNVLVEQYAGIVFTSGPEKAEAGVPFKARLALIYYPHPIYDSFVPGAIFTIREGPRIVGFGTVISNSSP